MLKRINYKKIIPVGIFLAAFLFMAFNSVEDKGKQLKKPTGITQGDAYRLQVNRLDMPLNSRGVLANVAISGIEQGEYDGKGFLFSGGFMISGKNGALTWASAVASASRIEDYLPGEVGGTNDPRAHIYVLKSTDDPFGQSWQEWKDAVDLGAYFYDGDGDNIYDPTDKNGNGIWDPDEDMPDLLGDETVWCVYNDDLPQGQRAFETQYPMGIEVRQTVWGYAVAGELGNMLFIRYSVNNAGTIADVLDSVYFGVWDDPDIGGGDGYTDDLVGCDPSLNAGFTYNDGPDDTYGIDPPCFLVDFFQGPWEETGNPSDVAYNVKGPLLGIDTIYGALNLPQTSFVHYMQSHPTQGDPDDEFQARNYLLGKNQAGNIVNPCNWEFGSVFGGVDCSTIDGRFMYSGDPVSLKGWINNTPTDQRQMLNTGPFTLAKDKPVDIVVAYVLGRSTSALTSILKAKQYDRVAQFLFDNNFIYPPTPPVVTPVIMTTDKTIELIWETTPQMSYNPVGRGYNMVFEQYEVHMYQTNSLSPFEGGRENRKLIASFDVANDINNVLYEDPISLERTVIYSKGTQLDSVTYASSDKGRISLRITTDPFTLAPLIKGKPYFISIVPTAYNREELEQLNALGDYLIPRTAVLGSISPVPTILSDGVSSVGIVPGKDSYAPYKYGIEADHYQGGSDAIVTYDVKDRSKITNHQYEVSFKRDSLAEFYELYYFITDLNTNEVIIDSSKQYETGIINDLVGGTIVNVEWIVPGVSGKEFVGTNPWFDQTEVKNQSGIFYMGADIDDPNGNVTPISNAKSKITKLTELKKVELRFGQNSNAYRYINRAGFGAYRYAGDSGFVQVPFQAWVKDESLGLEYQLAVGYIETQDSGGAPNGIYDPGFNVTVSKEYIVIFNSPYDPTGDGYAYTGTGPNSWANIAAGYSLNPTDPRFNDSLKTIASSPWFDALFVAGLQRTGSATVPMTGTYVISVAHHLTTSDKYRFIVNSDLSSDEEKELFNKVNVFPNPLFAYNPGGSYTGAAPDAPYVTFSNLPEEVTIKIYTLSGILIRTLGKSDASPYMNWNLQNEDGLRVASGMYIAVVSNPALGEKILKFAIIQPQKQIKRF